MNSDLCFTSHNGLLFVLGLAWAEDKTPACHEFISGVLHASFARQTIRVFSGCVLPLTPPWLGGQISQRFSSKVQSPHSTEVLMSKILTCDCKIKTKCICASGGWPKWGLDGDLLACLNVCEWVRTDLPMLSGQADEEHFYIIASHFSSSSPHLFSSHFANKPGQRCKWLSHQRSCVFAKLLLRCLFVFHCWGAHLLGLRYI